MGLGTEDTFVMMGKKTCLIQQWGERSMARDVPPYLQT